MSSSQCCRLTLLYLRGALTLRTYACRDSKAIRTVVVSLSWYVWCKRIARTISVATQLLWMFEVSLLGICYTERDYEGIAFVIDRLFLHPVFYAGLLQTAMAVRYVLDS